MVSVKSKNIAQNGITKVLRLRDIIAAICVAILFRLSYIVSQGPESLTASVDLTFYTDFISHTYENQEEQSHDYQIAKPVPFDLDGDGCVEALVVASNIIIGTGSSGSSSTNHHHWGLKVLDLRPLHPSKSLTNENLPFYPKAIFQTHDEHDSIQKRVPVKMITGQVILRDRNRRDGNGDEDSELSKSNEEDGSAYYVKNPNDGLPSVATIWSNGDVSLHSITARDEDSSLDLIEMWNVNPFGHEESDGWIDYIEVGLLLETDAPVGKYGALVVAVRYYTQEGVNGDNEASDSKESSVYFALDAFSGMLLWTNIGHHRHHSNQAQAMHGKENSTPLSSTENVSKIDESSESSEDCILHFRNLILDESSGVLPHAFWHQSVDRGAIEYDTKLVSSQFFDRKHQDKNSQNWQEKSGWLVKTIASAGKGKSRMHNRPGLHFRNPDVAVFHNRHGINILSLQNGKQVCNLSLLENVFYADVNQDGIIDQVQFTTNNDQTSERMQICQALIHSGIMTKSELGRISLCDDGSGIGNRSAIHSAPPLLVESKSAIGDMIFATNHGMIKRSDIQGKKIWTGKGRLTDIPGWDEIGGNNNGYLARVAFERNPSNDKFMLGMRPILLSGDNKVAIFTSGRGRLLDKATYPQMILGRPILHDVNGDGTTDLIVTTVDGIWGYCVTISTETSKWLQLLNGILLLLITFAFLVAHFDNTDGKGLQHRSTDF